MDDEEVHSDTVGISKNVEGKKKATIVCLFLGLGSLLAWNSMLTIADYYYGVFPNYHTSRVITIFYQIVALTTTGIFAYYEASIDTRKRNIFGFALFSLTTFGLIIIDLASSGKGGIISFLCICAMVVGFGFANALTQGGLVGDLAFMCPEFMQSYFGGMAIAGTLTSGLRLITKAVFDKTDHGLRKGTLLFLSISTSIELLCIFLYAYVFPKIPIIKYFRKKAASEGATTVTADLVAAGIQTSDINSGDNAKHSRLTNKQLILQNVDYAIDLFIIYALTLSIFPGFLYENTGAHQLGSWYAVVLIAMYNLLDLIGRYVPLIDCIRIESRKDLMIFCLARLLLVPCFYFTAKYADQGWMLMLVSFLGLTNGYLTICVLSVAPKGYKAPEQNALGNILVLFLIAGIVFGAGLDWLWLIGHGSF